jgi:peptidoglycan/LPS O-acetylase OafA/YrhL
MHETSLVPSTAPQDRSAGIDVSRGLCILFVILLHIEIRIPIESSVIGILLPRPLVSILFRSGFTGLAAAVLVFGFGIGRSTEYNTESLCRHGETCVQAGRPLLLPGCPDC